MAQRALSAGDLDRQIIAAHARGDERALASLYDEAARRAETDGGIDRACFFYVQAYVLALSSGQQEVAAHARARLVAHGRER